MKKRIGILLGVILAISALVAIFIIADGHNHTRIFSFQDTARLAEAISLRKSKAIKTPPLSFMNTPTTPVATAPKPTQ